MECRNITLTLDKAKKWYNSGSSDLREVALQAYTEKELKVLSWQNVKTFEDACYELAMHPYTVINQDIRAIKLSSITDDMKKHLIAVYKLDIIRKALNKGWNPKMTEGNVYYPYVRFYPAGNKAKEAARDNRWEVKETFNADGQEYTLVSGDYSCTTNGGLSLFGCGYGNAQPILSLLGCKSKEIAEHMSHYFAKEIFEATYAQHIGTYEWV